MASAWTWRQYTVFRALLGVFLLLHFAQLVPWGAEVFSNIGMLPYAGHSPLIPGWPTTLSWLDHPATITAILASGAVAALCLMVGRFDRWAAVWVWLVLACLFIRNPLIANPSMPVVGWLLLFHALLPKRREIWDTDETPGSASLPPVFVFLAWFMLAVAYSYSGWTKLFSEAWVQGETVRWVLQNPLARDTWLRIALLATPEWVLQVLTLGILVLELLFAPLALIPRARPWIWLGMLVGQLGFLVLLNFADLTTPMLLLHLLTFDPRWVSGRRNAAGTTVYYDGECGLCHGFIRFALAEDRSSFLRFAPMQGETAASAIPDVVAQDDYRSIIVHTPDGSCLERFAAVRLVLLTLGGLWGLLGRVLYLVPRGLGDGAYSIVARNRKRFFPAPIGLCPVLPRSLAARFGP